MENNRKVTNIIMTLGLLNMIYDREQIPSLIYVEATEKFKRSKSCAPT